MNDENDLEKRVAAAVYGSFSSNFTARLMDEVRKLPLQKTEAQRAFTASFLHDLPFFAFGSACFCVAMVLVGHFISFDALSFFSDADFLLLSMFF